MNAIAAGCPPELERLKAVLEDIAPASTGARFALAYSGGLDSRFLAFAAKRLGFSPVLLHIIGPQIAPEDTAQALKAAEALGLEALCVPVNSLSIPELAQSGKRRCYVCKKALFSALSQAAKALGELAPGAALCDGTNYSDLGAFRPGLEAIRELGIRSPLAEAKITKSQIRALGRAMGFPDPDQAARPCLLTRFPYGAVPSREMLRAVAAAEKAVAEAFGEALRFRVRVPGNNDVRLHVERQSLAALASARQLSPRDAAAELLAVIKRIWTGGEASLTVEVLDTLSGYYDQMPSAQNHV